MTWTDWQDQRSYLEFLADEHARAYADAHVEGHLGAAEVEAFVEARAALRAHDELQPVLADR